MGQQLSLNIRTSRTLKLPKRLLFYGIKHSGKSTIASMTAEHLGWAVTDSDELVLKHLPQNSTIRSFYAKEGREAFSDLEYQVCAEFLQNSSETPSVIALGGGACDNPRLMDLCRRSGIGLFLDVPETVLYRRIMSGGIPPFLSAEDPAESFHQLWKRRRNLYYSFCDAVLSGEDQPAPQWAEYLIQKLSELCERYYGRQQFR